MPFKKTGSKITIATQNDEKTTQVELIKIVCYSFFLPLKVVEGTGVYFFRPVSCIYSGKPFAWQVERSLCNSSFDML